MDLDDIKELMTSMESAKITKIRVKKKDGSELELERGEPPQVIAPQVHYEAPPVLSHAPAEHKAEEKAPEAQNSAPSIDSPMVGTFYAAASPEDPPFVKPGDTVDENTVVCIIEAMKVMNEVKAGVKGVITEVCAENAEPVEFGTPLFRIKK